MTARLRLTLLLLVALMAACGGGGDDEPGHSATIPGPPDCINRPELCT